MRIIKTNNYKNLVRAYNQDSPQGSPTVWDNSPAVDGGRNIITAKQFVPGNSETEAGRCLGRRTGAERIFQVGPHGCCALGSSDTEGRQMYFENGDLTTPHYELLHAFDADFYASNRNPAYPPNLFAGFMDRNGRSSYGDPDLFNRALMIEFSDSEEDVDETTTTLNGNCWHPAIGPRALVNKTLFDLPGTVEIPGGGNFTIRKVCYYIYAGPGDGISHGDAWTLGADVLAFIAVLDEPITIVRYVTNYTRFTLERKLVF